MLHHIFNNGWEDKHFIARAFYVHDQIRAEWRSGRPPKSSRVQPCSMPSTLKKARPRLCQAKTCVCVGAGGAPSKPFFFPSGQPVAANGRASCNHVCEQPAIRNLRRGIQQQSGPTPTLKRSCGATISVLDIVTVACYYGLVRTGPGLTGAGLGGLYDVLQSGASTKYRLLSPGRPGARTCSRTWNCRAARGPAWFATRPLPTLMTSSTAA